VCSGPTACARGGSISGRLLCIICYDSLEGLCSIRYHPGLSVSMELGMSLLSSAAVLSLVDSMAIVLAQAYQLARARLASAASPIMRLLVQRDQAGSEPDHLPVDRDRPPAQRVLGILHPPTVVIEGIMSPSCTTGSGRTRPWATGRWTRPKTRRGESGRSAWSRSDASAGWAGCSITTTVGWRSLISSVNKEDDPTKSQRDGL
jgi:hypothetical protein